MPLPTCLNSWIALESEPYELSAEERANIEEAPDGVRRGEFATDAEVAAVFARYDS